VRRLAVLAALAACPGARAPASAIDQDPPAVSHLDQAGIVTRWLDRTADPCRDFYRFACGGFADTTEIPIDRRTWSATEIVVSTNEELLRGVLERAAAQPGDPLGAYYTACMDEAAIEQAGLAPIQPLLDLAASARDAKSAAAAVIALHAAGVFPLFGIGAQQDFADATQVIAALDQGGLGLPDRAYYLDDKGSLPRTRELYQAHIARMFALLGDAAPNIAALDVMRVETVLARLHQDVVVRRDPRAMYHRIDLVGLERIAPTFRWRDYLARLGVTATAITVNDPAYYTAIAKLLATEAPGALQHYFAWTVLRATASLLGSAWVNEAHRIVSDLGGERELPPRWRRCLARADSDLGDLLGQAYVRQRFPADARPRTVELVTAVLGAMRAQFDRLWWMDEPTRDAARAKLDRMTYLVGYPDRWRSYDFAIGPAFASNVQAATRFELARQLAKIGKPVDRDEWQMTPQTVNAYYDPLLNEFALPAGVLQPPLFAVTYHPAANFGATGAGTIGHEITHGFDDEGSEFDGNGTMHDWWTPATQQGFTDASRCVVEQYGKYEPAPGLHLDGKLTAGENIADAGGVTIAFVAYQTYKAHHAVVPAVDGFTDDQLFFLSYAQSWCAKLTPGAIETMVRSNPHAPPQYRVEGVVANEPAFAAAFKCPPPAKPCTVW